MIGGVLPSNNGDSPLLEFSGDPIKRIRTYPQAPSLLHSWSDRMSPWTGRGCLATWQSLIQAQAHLHAWTGDVSADWTPDGDTSAQERGGFRKVNVIGNLLCQGAVCTDPLGKSTLLTAHDGWDSLWAHVLQMARINSVALLGVRDIGLHSPAWGWKGRPETRHEVMNVPASYLSSLVLNYGHYLSHFPHC